MNYATLSQLIQDYLENNETSFVANIPNIVMLAEERIYRAVALQFLQKTSTSSTAAGNPFLNTPTDFLTPLSMQVIPVTTRLNLIYKDYSFLVTAFSSTTAEGVPVYYCLFDHNTFMLFPTPDSVYVTELQYIYKPTSIVSASTTWLGDNAENALLYGCLIEAYRYEKGDAELFQVYNENYQEAVVRLKILAEGQNRPPDAYKAPTPMIGKT